MKRLWAGMVLVILLSGVGLQAQTNYQTGFTEVQEISEKASESWFRIGYSSYDPDEGYLETLKGFPENAQILVFAGTWCPDTRRVLPAFYKAADLAGIPHDKILLYLLDPGISSEDGLEELYNIRSVPTFIIMENGLETARFVDPGNAIEEEFARHFEGQ